MSRHMSQFHGLASIVESQKLVPLIIYEERIYEASPVMVGKIAIFVL